MVESLYEEGESKAPPGLRVATKMRGTAESSAMRDYLCMFASFLSRWRRVSQMKGGNQMLSGNLKKKKKRKKKIGYRYQSKKDPKRENEWMISFDWWVK